MVSFSNVPGETLPANAIDGPDYLELPLAWTPTRRFDHRQVYEYQLPLGSGKIAILELVADKGWALRITHDGQPDVDRGLFGTPHDGLMVLATEFVLPAVEVERRAEAGAKGPPARERERG